MADIKLKPCPFCGGEAIIKHYIGINFASSYVECTECHARTDEKAKSFEIASDMVVAERWNRRADNDD